MKPDKLDIKIQEAAAQYEPDKFNERAWDNFKIILDKELPEKKNPKKNTGWLFLFIFMVTGTLLLITIPWKTTDNMHLSQKENHVNTSQNTLKDPFVNSTKIPAKNSNNPGNQSSQLSIHEIKKLAVLQARKSSIMPSSAHLKVPSNEKAATDLLNYLKPKTTIANYTFIRAESLTDWKQSLVKINEPVKSIINDPTKKGEEKIFKEKKNSEQEKFNNKPFIKSISIDLSIGPEISATDIRHFGKMEPIFGAGISFNPSKKWTIRSGFFVAKKVYSTNTSEYHPPENFWYNFPDLKSVKADCNVYEIPLILNFNFKQSLKYQWFGGIGVSSYFMKKEDYDFISKNPSGQGSYSNYSIRNENKHFFSSLRVSAGYERSLKKPISLVAEPYLNIPISGVGYGKVKLYNAGILLTLRIKPFSGRKEKSLKFKNQKSSNPGQ
jgi:hypothetical protein